VLSVLLRYTDSGIPLVSSSPSYNRYERKGVTWKQLYAIILFIDINIYWNLTGD
jgi:hypothetical protein